MYFKKFVAVATVVAATSLPFAVHAQEVHTLTPHFPDAFKVRSTATSDAEMTMPNQTGGTDKKGTHSTVSWTADTKKTADGYHATVMIENMAVDTVPPMAAAAPATPAPAGTTAAATPPMDPAELAQKMTALLKLIGNAEVSYDGNMRPLRVDNLDALKANVKSMIMMGASTQDAPKITSMFDLFTKDITPESAASLLRQSTQSRLPYGKPLALNTPVALDPATSELYGAKLTIGGTATLTSWEEGKAAHMTVAIQAPEAEFRTFAITLANNFMDKIMVAMGKQAKPEEMAQVKTMIARVVNGMSIQIGMSCKVDVDLTNTALTHSDCTSDVLVKLDTSKMLTPEQLKASPDLATKMKVYTVTQTSHSVSDTVLATN